MINPYAQAFMIATRTEPFHATHLRPVSGKATPKGRLRLFRRVRAIDPTRL